MGERPDRIHYCQLGKLAVVKASNQNKALVDFQAKPRRTSADSNASTASCPSEPEIPFNWILAEITGKHGRYDFVLTELARCPNCKQPVTEKTLVEPR